MPAAGGRQLVVARAAIVVGHTPIAGDQAPRFETMQRLVQRAVVEVQRTARTFLEPEADLEAMQGPGGHGAEAEDVQRAAKNRELVRGRRHRRQAALYFFRVT